jgi:hypothetical protein
MMRSLATTSVVVALTISSASCAAAQPSHDFPDLSGLVDVTPSLLGTTPRDAGGFTFSVPVADPDHGFTCHASSGGADCSGVLPGLASVPLQGPMQGPCDRGDVATGNPLRHYHGVCEGPGSKMLHPGQKATLGPVTCGVLPGDVTACTNGEHGFVLQQSGSFSF